MAAKRVAETDEPLSRRVVPRLFDYMDSLSDKKEKTVDLKTPEELYDIFRDAGIPLELGGATNGKPGQEIVHPDALCKSVDLLLKYSVRSGSPMFFNQLFGKAHDVSVAADWVATSTNTSAYTYEVAPVYTLLEVEVLKKVAKVIGGAFADAHDGLFVPGGSLSNLYAIHLAHHRADPELAKRGAVGGPRCVAYTSDQSHYSYLKSSRLTGLGSDNLVKIATDECGRMIPEKLEEAILKTKSEGGKPFFVGSTAGSTVLGSYDPFVAIAEICKKHGLWQHIDGAWGAGAMLSPTQRHNMAGCELADSLSWNPHKMSGATLQSSLFISRHRGILEQVCGTKAAYLFQPDKLNANLDMGDKTIQCGRKTDMLKVWMMWKAQGDAGMARTVDHCFNLAACFAKTIRDDPSGQWELAYEPSCTNVCFWYVPPQLRPFKFATASQAQRDALHQAAPRIKSEMQKQGDALIGFQAVNGRPNFFRMVFASKDDLDNADVVALLGRIAALGEKLCSDIVVN